MTYLCALVVRDWVRQRVTPLARAYTRERLSESWRVGEETEQPGILHEALKTTFRNCPERFEVSVRGLRASLRASPDAHGVL